MTDEPLAEGGPVDAPVFVEPDASCVLYFVTDYRRVDSVEILREAATWYASNAEPGVTGEYGSPDSPAE